MESKKDITLLQALFDFFSGKAKTRIYTTFLGWFLIFHIDIIFLSVLVDQSLIFEKTGLLKGEYLWSYISYFGIWSISIELLRLVAAVLATYLMIWVIPKLISEKSYVEELKVEYALRKLKVEKEEALGEREKNVVEQKLETIEEEKKVVTERAKIEGDPKQLRLESEFEEFIKIPNARETLQEVSNTVYAEGGNLYEYTAPNGWLKQPTGVKPDNLALADTNGLIEFTDKGRLLALTSKGKQFIKLLNARDVVTF